MKAKIKILLITIVIITECLFSQQVFKIYYGDRLFYWGNEVFFEKNARELKDGKYIVFSRLHKDSVIEQMVNIKNGLYDGVHYRNFHANNFNGEKRDLFIMYEYYEKGELIGRKEIRGDTINVHAINYYSAAKKCDSLSSESPLYRGDVIDGVSVQPDKNLVPAHLDSIICYWNSRQRKSAQYFLNCLQYGKFYSWSKDGGLLSFGQYDKGKPSGEWRGWDYGGNLIERSFYRNGTYNRKVILHTEYGLKYLEEEIVSKSKITKTIHDFLEEKTDIETSFFKKHKTEKTTVKWKKKHEYNKQTLEFR